VDRHRQSKTNLGHALYLLLAYELYLRSTEEGPSAQQLKKTT
jgi:hypothetical protein